MTQKHTASRPWRLRTLGFGLFAGLSVFLIENLIDPFLPKDSNNSQLWGNTIVAVVAGLIGLLFSTYLTLRALRRGFLEKGYKKGEFSLPVSIQYWMMYVLGALLMGGLIFVTA